jgi:hypothetical protein
MRMSFCVAAFLALQTAAQGAAGCGGHGDRATMLVTANWLTAHLDAKPHNPAQPESSPPAPPAPHLLH